MTYVLMIAAQASASSQLAHTAPISIARGPRTHSRR